MKTWIVNPLEDVFRNSKDVIRGWGSRIEDHIISIAQNARESIQVAVSADEESTAYNCYVEILPCKDYGDNGISFDCGGIRFIRTSAQSKNICDKVKRCDLPGELPECIDPSPMNITFGQSASFFITAQTEKNAIAGIYEYTARIHYGMGRKKKPHTIDQNFKVEVFPVCIPDAKDSEYCHDLWLNLCGTPMPEDSENPYIASFNSNAKTYGIETFSEEWFTLIKNYAVVLKKERMNVISIPYYPLLYKNVKIGENGEYIFDFTLFDRLIDTFIEYGDIKYFCGFHLMQKVDTMLGMDDDDKPEFPLATVLYEPDRGIENFHWIYMNDERAWNHLENLITAVYNHVKERGLANRWLQHVSDEVEGDEAFETVSKAYKLVHKLAPEFKTIDATWNSSLERYGEDLDIHVPATYVHDENLEQYNDALKNMNIDVWSYTSLQPQFSYMSRLDDWKLICSRLLHWYNFKNNLSGYLCWAWNWWFYAEPWQDSLCGGWPLDGWVVFPDVENLSVLESVRLRECVSGIYDIELLKICDKIDSEKTRMLVDILVNRANDFTVDSDVFFRIRRILLEMASDKNVRKNNE